MNVSELVGKTSLDAAKIVEDNGLIPWVIPENAITTLEYEFGIVKLFVNSNNIVISVSEG